MIDVQRLNADSIVVKLSAHSHNFFELVYFDSGTGVHTVGSRRIMIKTGEVHFIKPGEIHDLRKLGSATGWIVLFQPECLNLAVNLPDKNAWTFQPLLRPFLSQSLQRNGAADELCCVVPENSRNHFSSLLTTLADELKEPRVNSDLAANALMALVLVNLSRYQQTQFQLSRSNQIFVNKVFSWIDIEYAKQWQLSDLAKHVHFSASYLSSHIKALTGRPIRDWVIERRMAEARTLLCEGKQVGLIAELVGYNDQALFVKHFAAKHGATPKRWAQLAVQNN
jgi:AraC family transcriptional regulator, transcriptional activator of pobA